MADLRYKVLTDTTVAGHTKGDIIRVTSDPDGWGRHAVGDELVRLDALVESGLIEPQSQAATDALNEARAIAGEPALDVAATVKDATKRG